MGDFRSYIEHKIGVSLEAFAHVSGVPFPVLESLDRARVRIDPLHKDAILRLAPDIPEYLFTPKPLKEPVLTKVTKGHPRHEDDEILAVNASDITVGDYLSMSLGRSAQQSSWAKVVHIEVTPQSTVKITLEGEAEVTTFHKSMAVISRPRR